jgi:Putative bacterial sensory transduction regulator
MNPFFRFVLVAVASIAAISSHPASAKNVVADLDQIAELMKGAGYRAEIKGEKADRYIRSGSSGFNFSVFAYGCNDDGTKCRSIQFYAVFDPKVSPTLEKLNEFARDNRWGRYYLDKDADPVIEMDLDLEQGGMSEELFLDNVEYWDMAMGKFADFVFK